MEADEALPRHEDVDLHNELTPRERVDAILNASDLTTAQAVAALGAQLRENQGSFPHVVVARIMVSSTPGGEEDCEYRSYYGPFRNRRESESWAEQRFAGSDRVSWEVARIITSEMDAAERDSIRRVIEDE